MHDYTAHIYLTQDDLHNETPLNVSIPGLNRVAAEMTAEQMYPEAYFIYVAY